MSGRSERVVRGIIAFVPIWFPPNSNSPSIINVSRKKHPKPKRTPLKMQSDPVSLLLSKMIRGGLILPL